MAKVTEVNCYIDGIRYDFRCVRTRILTYLYICMDTVLHWVVMCLALLCFTALCVSLFCVMLRIHDEQNRRDRYVKEHCMRWKIAQESTASSIENEIVFNRFQLVNWICEIKWNTEKNYSALHDSGTFPKKSVSFQTWGWHLKF